MKLQLDQLFERMDKLNLWESVMANPWAFKPKGSIYPYIVYVSRHALSQVKGKDIKPRICLLFLEGWQTFHDFIRTQLDPNFGYYLMPADVPTIEASYFSNGAAECWRHDPGFVTSAANDTTRDMCLRMMWELYGIMLRLETDPKLPEKFGVAHRGMLCRTEKAPGKWVDEQLEAPSPQPYEEHRIIPDTLLKSVEKLTLDKNLTVEVDFRRALNIFVRTKGMRPRNIYSFFIVDAATGKRLFNTMTMVDKDLTLKKMLENVAANFLQFVEHFGSFPSTVCVSEGRVFRQLRDLTAKFPFKLVMRDTLPHMNEAFNQWEHETVDSDKKK